MAPPAFLVNRIGHMGLRVADLDRAVEFQTEVLGLVETERTGGASYLTCNDRHHELVLIQGGPKGYDHIGLQVRGPDELDLAIARARSAGAEVLGGVYDGEPGIDRALRIKGPGGHVYKLFCGMEKTGTAPDTDGLVKFEHVSVKARGLAATERFLQDAFGFRFSDRMGRTASWWHCDADHHGMALVFAPRPELSHYAWQFSDFGALGRVADRLAARGEKLTWGPSRHGPGNNHFIYFKDSEGAMVECCSEIAQMPPAGDYQPRTWPGGLGSINQWGSPPPLRFLLAGHPIPAAGSSSR